MPKIANFNIDEWDPTLLWCICRNKTYGQMVRCDGPFCQILWFHTPCIRLKKIPKGNWFCKNCRADMLKSENRSRNSRSSSMSTENSSFRKKNYDQPSTSKNSEKFIVKLRKIRSDSFPVSEFTDVPDERPEEEYEDDALASEEACGSSNDEPNNKNMGFNENILEILENEFQLLKPMLYRKGTGGRPKTGENPYIEYTIKKYKELSDRTGLSHTQISNWMGKRKNQKNSPNKIFMKPENSSVMSRNNPTTNAQILANSNFKTLQQTKILNETYFPHSMRQVNKNFSNIVSQNQSQVVSITSEPYFTIKNKTRKSLTNKPYYRFQQNQRNILEATYIKLEKAFTAQNKTLKFSEKICYGLVTQTGLTFLQVRAWLNNRRRLARFSNKKTSEPVQKELEENYDSDVFEDDDDPMDGNLDNTKNNEAKIGYADFQQKEQNLLENSKNEPKNEYYDDSDSDVEFIGETVRNTTPISNFSLPTPTSMPSNFHFNMPTTVSSQFQFPSSSQNVDHLHGTSFPLANSNPYVPTVTLELPHARLTQNSSFDNLPSISPHVQTPMSGISSMNQPEIPGPQLNVGGRLFNVRKESLTSISKYFTALYIVQEKHRFSVIEVPDVEADEFEQFLACVFPAGYPVTKDSVSVLLKLAKHFEVSTLIEKCEIFLNECPDNEFSTIDKLRLANSYDLKNVLDNVISKMSIKTFKKIRSDYDHHQLNDYIKARLYEHLIHLI